MNQARRERAPPNLRPNPLVRRHHAHRVARHVPLQRAAGALSAAAGRTACRCIMRVHARQVDRRCVGLLHQRGRSELSAEQPRPRRRSAARRHSTSGIGSRQGAIMPVPFGTGQPMLANQGWLSKALPTWKCGWSTHVRAGRPFTVALLPDMDNSNTGRSNLGFGNNDRPNVSGRHVAGDEGTADEWFDTAAFSMPAFGTFGNSRAQCLPGARAIRTSTSRWSSRSCSDWRSPSSCGSKRSTCSTASTTICPTRSSDRRRSAGSCRRRVRGDFSWGSGGVLRPQLDSVVSNSRGPLKPKPPSVLNRARDCPIANRCFSPRM